MRYISDNGLLNGAHNIAIIRHSGEDKTTLCPKISRRAQRHKFLPIGTAAGNDILPKSTFKRVLLIKTKSFTAYARALQA